MARCQTPGHVRRRRGARAYEQVVVAGAPAAQAGVKAGDVVTAIDGNPVTSADDLTSSLGSRLPGDVVTLTVDRSGTTKTIQVTLGDRPSSPTTTCS